MDRGGQLLANSSSFVLDKPLVMIISLIGSPVDFSHSVLSQLAKHFWKTTGCNPSINREKKTQEWPIPHSHSPALTVTVSERASFFCNSAATSKLGREKPTSNPDPAAYRLLPAHSIVATLLPETSTTSRLSLCLSVCLSVRPPRHR